MPATELDAGPFLAGLREALADFDAKAEEVVLQVGAKVVSLAEGFAPHGATGVLEGSIHSDPGRDAKGPYVDVGTQDPVGFFQEFGTWKMKAHPFMRPALAQAGAALRAAGARTGTRSSRGARGIRKRAALRTQLRKAYRGGRLSAGQARSAAQQLSRISARQVRFIRRLRIS